MTEVKATCLDTTRSYHLCLTLGTFIPTFGKQTANGHLREGRFPWRKWDFSSEVIKKIVNVEIKYKKQLVWLYQDFARLFYKYSHSGNGAQYDCK